MEELSQSYLEIEFKDCSPRISLLGKKALQSQSGDRCFNSQHLMSGLDIKQAKDPPVFAINRVVQNLLLKVLAAFEYDLNGHLWISKPPIEILSLEFDVAQYLTFLAIDEFRFSDRTLVAISAVDLSLTIRLDDALVSFGSILIGAGVAACGLCTCQFLRLFQHTPLVSRQTSGGRPNESSHMGLESTPCRSWAHSLSAFSRVVRLWLASTHGLGLLHFVISSGRVHAIQAHQWQLYLRSPALHPTLGQMILYGEASFI